MQLNCIEGDDIVENRVENVSVEDDSIENSSVGLNVSAYDHWSTDMKQDTWFTASCFEAVFNNIDKKPKWIKVILDNGLHYYNSKLMAIVVHWSNWYNIEVRGWLFLELGEAKIQLIHIMQQ
ncbi:20307_t:CDS:2 [Gigaspora rosea]|nr:20307_t:CDS:2 [Gigaspora rosea]